MCKVDFIFGLLIRDLFLFSIFTYLYVKSGLTADTSSLSPQVYMDINAHQCDIMLGVVIIILIHRHANRLCETKIAAFSQMYYNCLANLCIFEDRQKATYMYSSLNHLLLC